MTKNPIIVLSPELANMIAAGEVVERPLSVVKELVENSIDANASNIKVDLSESGLRFIKVTDDGDGMTKDEIPLALKRHATSKICNQHDLFSIMSLGFRGEALPSIASVSKMRIISSTGDVAYFYEFQASSIIDEGPIAFPKGTKIEVSDLFYNTPARYKHLSNLTTELSHIINFVNRLAIAYPEIAFTIINNGKVLLKTLGDNNLQNVIAETVGNDVAKNLIPFSSHNNLYQIKGYTSKNSIFRSNKNNINIIVNKRIIRNSQLIYAITDSYKSILPTGKYPITILEISTDPSIIDVNVHPSKLEIRFTDELKLRSLITETISKALHQTPLIYENKISSNNLHTSLFNQIESEQEEVITEDKETLFTSEQKKESVVKNNEYNIDNLWNEFTLVKENNNDDSVNIIESPSIISKEQNSKEEKVFTKTLSSKPVQEKVDLEKEENNFFSSLHYIGQYNKTYLLFEQNNDLYLIDQHAAMERCMYEKISATMNQNSSEKYDLLVPLHYDFNSSEVLLIEEKKEELNNLGFEIEPFGNTTIIIRSVPTWIPSGHEDEFIYELITSLISNKKVNKALLYDDIAKSMSCKKSIKAHMAITLDEINHLMHLLDHCKMPYTCPHGRPTLIKLSLYEIEKLFKRVM